MPAEIRRLADGLLQQPHVVELAQSRPAATIDHALVGVRQERKRDLLERILSEDGCESAIVFTRTKHRAKRLAQQLDRAGHRAVGLQGNMSQPQRDRAMQGFRKRRFDVLVATDIAARGIDVQGVSHVINFDVPSTPDAYTHRIGRTGRAERAGRALTFVTRDDADWLRATERMLGGAIPRRTVDGFETETVEAGGAPAGGRRVKRGRGGATRNGRRSRRRRRPGR
jgi:ATP-dependent RNA helicase RhlE